MYKVKFLIESPFAIEIIDLEFAVRWDVMWLYRTQIRSCDFCLWVIVCKVDSLRTDQSIIHLMEVDFWRHTYPDAGSGTDVQGSSRSFGNWCLMEFAFVRVQLDLMHQVKAILLRFVFWQEPFASGGRLRSKERENSADVPSFEQCDSSRYLIPMISPSILLHTLQKT